MENKKTEEIMREVRKVIFGKDECIRQVMTAIRGYPGGRQDLHGTCFCKGNEPDTEPCSVYS